MRTHHIAQRTLLSALWSIKKSPKETTRNLLDLISKFSKVAGYMIKTQKPAEFLDNSNEQSERKLKKQSRLQ